MWTGLCGRPSFDGGRRICQTGWYDEKNGASEPARDIVDIAWCEDVDQAGTVAALFIANADTTYISHSELQFGRAASPKTWAPDLLERVHRTVTGVISEESGRNERRLATVMRASTLIGFAFVTLSRNHAGAPFATIEDFLISSHARSDGMGARLLAWVTAECKLAGILAFFWRVGLKITVRTDFSRAKDLSRRPLS